MRLSTRLASVAALLVGVVTVTALAQPQRGGGMMMGGGGPLALINSKTVQAEIKMTEEQVGQIKDWVKEYMPKMGEMMKEKFAEIPKDQMREKFGEIQAEMQKTLYKELGGVLNPDQIKRLKQIDVQFAGLRAFTNAEVVSALKLTDEQKDKLKDANETMQRDMRELRDEYGIKGFNPRPTDAGKAAEFEKKSSALTKETMEKIMGMMTSEQKSTWKELTGAPFDVAKLQAEMRGAGRGGFQGKKKKIDD